MNSYEKNVNNEQMSLLKFNRNAYARRQSLGSPGEVRLASEKSQSELALCVHRSFIPLGKHWGSYIFQAVDRRY